MVDNFNTNLAVTEGREREEGVAASMAEEGLEDMIGLFLSQHNLWLMDGRTWAMHRGVQ